jgi:peptidoglycan hydrolase-like protein with peptidoglycan-binding domain
MKDWKTIVAVVLATAVITGPVWAQTSMPSDKDKGTGTTGSTGTGGTSDTMKSGEASKPDMSKDMGKMDRRAGSGKATEVKAAQQALKDKGHDPGPIDARMGPKTRAAVKDFQKAEGLKESGRLDPETMAKLGVDARTGAAGASSPAASPGTDKPTKPSDTGVTGEKKTDTEKK